MNRCAPPESETLACPMRGNLLYHFDQVFSHASRPKKSLTQNVFLLIYLIFLVFFLTIFFQMCEHLVEMVQYLQKVGRFSELNYTTHQI
jgi:hypothetical protein